MLELDNRLLPLKKGSMFVDEFTNDFTDKMESFLHVVSEKLWKIDTYSRGLPWEYSVPVKHPPTFEEAIFATRFIEDMIKRRTVNKTEVDEKGKSEELPNSL